ncbi:MAG: sensor histidine kinase [Acidimicrobiales bacterium]
MTRRLTAAMVLMVVAALILSGLVTLYLAALSNSTQTRNELVREGVGLAAGVQQEARNAPGGDPAKALRSLLLALRGPFRLDGSAVVAVLADGRIFDPVTPRVKVVLPPGVTVSDLDTGALYQLHTVSGDTGGVVFAAVPYEASILILGQTRQVVQAVVLTRTPPSAWSTAGPWFLVSSLAIIAVAWLVAYRLGRRFVSPIRATQIVTSRIASGDLDARVTLPSHNQRDPELTALARSVNSMAEDLGRVRADERRFLQSVSHDLRTPLTSIRGFAEAIEDGATQDAKAAARVIAGQARRLERLVADLLALATLQARRFTLEPATVDFGAVVSTAATAFNPAADELGISLRVDAPAGVCTAVVDPDRLAQVTANLIENALRYAGSYVEVRAGRSTNENPISGWALAAGGWAGWVDLTVSDDGPGIPADALSRVFERLFVARPGPDRPIGSGLGLAIVHELVTAMGGHVHAESPTNRGGGTRMVVSLPAGPLTPAEG